MRKNFFAIRPIHTLFAGLLSAVILVGLSLPAKAGAEMALSGKGTKLAYASTQTVEVDGKPIEFQMYALKDANGYDTNYVKLRDVAYVLNDTEARFSVEWHGAVRVSSGRAYTANGSEMYTPYRGDRPYTQPDGVTIVDGEECYLDAIVLTDDNGGGYTYYKLRDLGDALGFTVDWSNERGVYIETQPAQGEEAEAPGDEPEEEPAETETPAETEEPEEIGDPEETENSEDVWEEVPFENNAYIVLSLDMVTTWEDACNYCAEQGGHMVTIDSQAENDYIRTLLADAEVNFAFLGLSKEEDIWSWYNGFPLHYSNWASGQPGSGSYAAMSRDGKWSAETFSGPASFICEWDN